MAETRIIKRPDITATEDRQIFTRCNGWHCNQMGNANGKYCDKCMCGHTKSCNDKDVCTVSKVCHHQGCFVQTATYKYCITHLCPMEGCYNDMNCAIHVCEENGCRELKADGFIKCKWHTEHPWLAKLPEFGCLLLMLIVVSMLFWADDRSPGMGAALLRMALYVFSVGR